VVNEYIYLFRWTGWLVGMTFMKQQIALLLIQSERHLVSSSVVGSCYYSEKYCYSYIIVYMLCYRSKGMAAGRFGFMGTFTTD
jgi:hypothetical protein